MFLERGVIDGDPNGAAIVAVLVAVIGLFVIPATAPAVSVECAADPSALQPAIDAAEPSKNLFISGTCSGVFAVAKNLRLTGAPGSNATLSDPNDSGVYKLTASQDPCTSQRPDCDERLPDQRALKRWDLNTGRLR